MCGRFSLMAIAEVLTDRYALSLGMEILFEQGYDTSEIVKRYNVSPGQDVPVVVNKPEMMFSLLKWGLVPHWAKDTSMAFNMINARGETLLEKPTYKGPFRHTRCLIPATGFYEWKKPDKIPFHFQMKDESVFSLAGLWDSWTKDGKEVRTFSIITTSPNELVKDLHDRMPVILDKKSEKYWLEDRTDDELMKLLRPYPADQMKRYEVSKLVNSSRSDSPEMVEPVKTKKSLFDY